ncbi:MAG TPA: hypothetical protein VHC92_03535 [Rhodanobacteraceae bacterium]|nr:hypothetical protein [Rhodanobacteraceae bacterium]
MYLGRGRKSARKIPEKSTRRGGMRGAIVVPGRVNVLARFQKESAANAVIRAEANREVLV